MAELLLEFLSEEIPARMQAKAEADLRDALTKGLGEAGVEFGDVVARSGPRRPGPGSPIGCEESNAHVYRSREGSRKVRLQQDRTSLQTRSNQRKNTCQSG